MECGRLLAGKYSDLFRCSLKIAVLMAARRNNRCLLANYMNNDKIMLTYQYNVFEIPTVWIPFVENQAY